MWPWNDPLDDVLYRWNKHDALTVRDLLAGGIHVFGGTGMGKTSAMAQIMRAIMDGNSSMLILCPKRNDAQEILNLVPRKRMRHVMVIDPTQKWRFNMLGQAGGAQNVAKLIMDIRSVICRESDQVGGDSLPWRRQEERLITNAVTVLQLAGEDITPGNLQEFILDVPQKPEQLHTPEWQGGYCNHCLKAAFHRPKSASQQKDFQIASDMFTRELPKMNDRTRTSIEAGTMSTLFTLNLGTVRELFATESNWLPARAIEDRKIVISNMPIDQYGYEGMVANVGLKFHWQKAVLERHITRGSPISCIWGDESGQSVTPSDSDYLSRCRSYRGCMVYLCQSLNSYREALPGEKADAAIKSMLGNFSHKLFFTLGDYETAEWAANLCGKELRRFAGGGIQHSPYDPFAMVREQGSYSSNFHEAYEYLIQPSEFLTGMRTGARANRYMVDGVLVRSGMPFSNGLPLLNVTFDQRK